MLLHPTDGEVSYSTASPFLTQTVATYTCDRGFRLTGGDMTRTCGGDGSSSDGMWSGTPPICEGILM